MSMHNAFLKDIITNPDDAPRLIYADWLDDHGQEARAEFIRVQIERTRLPKWDAARVRLRLREEALLKKHGKAWLAELPKIEGVTWAGFRRGLVAQAKLKSFALLRGRAWEGVGPIEAASVRWPRKGDGAEGIPPVPGLHELTVTGRLMAMGDAERLAASPLLSSLRVLDISGCECGNEGFGRVMRSPHLAGLRTLRAGSNYLGDGAISALCGAASIASLEELDLGVNIYGLYGEDPVIGAEGMRQLAGWPGLAALRRLNLARSSIGADGLRALLRSPHSAGLKDLRLHGVGLDRGEARVFKEARPGTRLDVLDLHYNYLEERGLRTLADAPCLAELKALGVESCTYDEGLSRAIGPAPWLRTLRWLNAGGNGITGRWAKALLDKRPPHLHTLRLGGNDIGDAGARAVAASPGAALLQELDLSYNDIGDEGAAALGASAHLSGLLVLASAATRSAGVRPPLWHAPRSASGCCGCTTGVTARPATTRTFSTERGGHE
jgi:uncharacterized protein (TIGR02996 family)